MYTKKKRLDLRINEEHKDLLSRAAATSGQNITSFILSVSLKVARELLEAEQVRQHTQRDQEKILNHLLEPSEPTTELAEAASRYEELILSGSE